VVAALWPERCAGLLTYNGYNIQHIESAMRPLSPAAEQRLWYQYYFHSERGRAGLAADRRALCRLLWQTWSPSWRFDEATYERTAHAFDHPDFVDVVIHSYRHRFGLVAGDPAYADIERRLSAQPAITVPTVSVDGTDDGVRPPAPAALEARHFTGPRSHRVVPGVGHNMPQELPGFFADTVLELVRGAVAAGP
jgi:pimeloyl-ACP methyl ester carboxylesterase